MITNKRELAELIPLAIEAIQAVGIVGESGKISKVYEGYINALGPAIIQSGLLPALIFYSKGADAQSKTEGNPSLWLKALFHMQKTQKGEPVDAKEGNQIIASLIGGRSGTIKELSKDKKLNELKDQVLQYAVALKLALRTFEIDDPNKSKEGGKV